MKGETIVAPSPDWIIEVVEIPMNNHSSTVLI